MPNAFCCNKSSCACSPGSRWLSIRKSRDLIPDQTILINAIPLQEAKLSSEIENIVTTQDALFKATLDERKPTDQRTKEVLRYRTALRYGYEALRKQTLSIHLLREVCSVLLGDSMDFRQPDELVVISNRTTGEIRYTPPRGGPALREQLKNPLNHTFWLTMGPIRSSA
ncbi:MAG TPA: hypothetical protein ENN68_01345 [Methanomicrobia archaeon]|nr:hypothetical protein [Methanomicrobia archaeon]